MIESIQRYGFVVSLIIGIGVVHVQNHLRPFKEPRLKKPLSLTQEPALNWTSWNSGEFQEKISDFGRDHLGFFNSILMNFNQIEYSVFNKPHAKKVVVGKDGYLYEEDYIRAYYARDLISKADFAARMDRMLAVKSGFDSMGVELMVLLAPGKGAYYPEYIPDHWRADKVPDTTNVVLYKDGLKHNGIHCLDLHSWFNHQKSTAKYPLFPQTGIHWSDYGMVLAIDTIIHFSEVILDCNLADIDINDIVLTVYPKDTDDDIEKGMNLMNRISTLELAYPKYDFESGAFDKKRMIMVGDSYGLGLYNRKLFTKSFHQGQFWFYNRSVYKEKHYATKLFLEDWMAEVDSADLIILQATDATLAQFPWRFIEDAHRRLYPMHPDHREKTLRIRAIEHTLRSNEETMEKLRAKALKSKMTLNVVIERETEYIYWKENRK